MEEGVLALLVSLHLCWMKCCCGSLGRGSLEQVGRSETKPWRQQEGAGGEEAGRAKSQSVSALCSESEETASLKGPGSTGLIRQKWKKFSR